MMAESAKTWWAPVWRGLVVDPEGKHWRRLKGALCLLLYCFLHADRTTGTLVRKYHTISHDMGMSVWTIRYWMRRLRDHGYVRLSGRGRAVTIQVLRWRTLGQRAARQRDSGLPVRGAVYHNVVAPRAENDAYLRAETGRGDRANKSLSTKVFLQQHVVALKTPFRLRPPPDARLRTREELLAADLAQGLDDPHGFGRYLRSARQYPEPLLRRLLSEVRAVPEAQIKRSRAALFSYLLRHHAE